MFEPVFHYLIESVRICADVTDVPVAVLVGWLVGFVVLSATLATLRARARR